MENDCCFSDINCITCVAVIIYFFEKQAEVVLYE